MRSLESLGSSQRPSRSLCVQAVGRASPCQAENVRPAVLGSHAEAGRPSAALLKAAKMKLQRGW